MAFDLAILGDDGKPFRQVSIGVNEHFQLLLLAKELRLTMIQRMSDYYADVEFSYRELDELTHEFNVVQKSIISKEKSIPTWLPDVIALIREAMAKSTDLIGIAD